MTDNGETVEQHGTAEWCRRPPKQHELKCWPRYFERILDGTKTFEVRRDDRGFKSGDVLWLREWEPGGRGFTGRNIRKRVMFVYHWAEDDLGLMMLKNGTCVMALGAEYTSIGHAHDAYVNAAAQAASGRQPCIVDEDGGVCGEDECPRCGAANGRTADE
jgi:hypothetical protein